ncbi:MAG: NADH-quinone oxidoreductase subunit NuoF [Anaerolineae bacterium]|nr:NADH-quinone oxidoreductase subunit NuoF [Anaerolineae bacterium]
MTTIYEELQEQANAELQKRHTHCVRVCMAAGCLSHHGDTIKKALEAEIEAQGCQDDVTIKGVGCMGLCAAGPLVSVEPEGILYEKVTVEDAADIVKSVGNKPLKRLQCATNVPFFKRQVKIVLENSGVVDPESLEDYILAGGYAALDKALTDMSPAEVIDEVVISGLRGRGGGGYPTGLKWSTVAKAISDTKYVICNADEGDPGAFMDRSVLESDPHRVIEGMAIAAYAVGAEQAYVYLRAEYPLAIQRLKMAIRQAKRSGLLGDNILGSGVNFNVDIRLGAGAFVCGEETALMASIEGKRGMPRPRPPYPADHGLWGEPTLINNVETFANVAPIIRNGGAWYAGIGTKESKGTKVFALAGQIKNTGLIEVPMGISLNEIVNEIGGGTPDGSQIKAIQTGGPSGGCIPNQYIETPVDYESLSELGSIMGSGGMIVMDSSSSMVEVARYFMEFCKTESCGKCIPCRVGTAQMYNLLDKIATGKATSADLELLEQLCDLVKNTSLCGLGQSAPNPVLSTLRYFREEYLTKIVDATDKQSGS